MGYGFLLTAAMLAAVTVSVAADGHKKMMGGDDDKKKMEEDMPMIDLDKMKEYIDHPIVGLTGMTEAKVMMMIRKVVSELKKKTMETVGKDCMGDALDMMDEKTQNQMKMMKMMDMMKLMMMSKMFMGKADMDMLKMAVYKCLTSKQDSMSGDSKDIMKKMMDKMMDGDVMMGGEDDMPELMKIMMGKGMMGKKNKNGLDMLKMMVLAKSMISEKMMSPGMMGMGDDKKKMMMAMKLMSGDMDMKDKDPMMEKKGEMIRMMMMKMIMQAMSEMSDMSNFDGMMGMESMMGLKSMMGMGDDDKDMDALKEMLAKLFNMSMPDDMDTANMTMKMTKMKEMMKMMMQKGTKEMMAFSHMLKALQRAKEFMFCSKEARKNEMAKKFCLGAMDEMRNRLQQPALPTGGQMKSYLDVLFRVPNKVSFTNYCCRDFHYPPSVTMLDPFHWRDGIYMHRFQNEKPIVSLQDGDPKKLYTFIIVDVSLNIPNVGTAERPVVHWLYVNSRAPSMTSGDEKVEYLPPINPHLFMYMVFEQEQEIDPNIASFGVRCGQTGPERCFFDIQRFIRENSLNLAAFNFFNAKRDAFFAKSRESFLGMNVTAACRALYPDLQVRNNQLECPTPRRVTRPSLCSYDSIQDGSGMQNCLRAINQAASSANYSHPFIPKDGSLDLFLEIRLRSERAMSAHGICCFDYFRPATETFLDPLNKMGLPTTMFGPNPQLTVKSGSQPNGISSSDLYTVVMVDRTPWTFKGENRSSATMPWLHWLKVNIPGNNMAAGDVLKSLKLAETQNKHEFYLYRQNNRIVGVRADDYTSTCGYIAGRCMFDLARFVRNNGLTMRGVNFFRGFTDGVLAFKRIQNLERPLQYTCNQMYKDLKFHDNKPMCLGYSPCNKMLQHEDPLLQINCKSILTQELQGMALSFVPTFTELTNPMMVYYSADSWSKKGLCCHDFYLPKKKWIIDPIEDKMGVPAYVTREAPKIHFKNETGKLYTIAVMTLYAGMKETEMFHSWTNPFLLMLKTNVDGSGMGDKLTSYLSPMVPYSYNVIFLYEQSGQQPIQASTNGYVQACVNDTFAEVGNQRCFFNIAGFVSRYSLKMVGASWFRTKMDPYLAYKLWMLGESEAGICPAIWPMAPIVDGKLHCPQNNMMPLLIADRMACMKEKRMSMNGMMKCLHYQTIAARELSQTLLPMKVQFSTYVTIAYHFNKTETLNNVCCRDYYFGPSKVILDPLTMRMGVPLYKFRDGEPVYAHLQGATNGKYYTFMMIDATQKGTDAKPAIHWMYVNVIAPTLTNGDRVFSYKRPRHAHLYLYLVFEQKDKFTNFNVNQYGSQCQDSQLDGNRCKFDMKKLWKGLELKLVGATWFKGIKDGSYVNDLIQESGQTPAAACKDMYPDIITNGNNVQCNAGYVWAKDTVCKPDARNTQAGMDACLNEMNGAIANWTSPFVPNNQRFDTYLDIRLRVRESNTHHVCCFNYKQPALDVTLDPVMPPHIPVSVAREVPNVILRDRTRPNGINDNNLYTLMLVKREQMTKAGEQLASNERPWVNWLRINMPSSGFGGNDLATYYAPTNGGRFEFYLYRQNGRINNADINRYVSSCTTLPGRCMMNVNQFVSDFGLRLSSVNWLHLKQDDYYAFLNIKDKKASMEDTCKNIFPGMKFEDGKPKCMEYSPCAEDQLEHTKVLCKRMVGAAASLLNRPWLPTQQRPVVPLKLKYKSEPLEFNVCCKEFSYREMEYEVDPVKAMRGVDTFLLRKKPKLYIEGEPGKKYTVAVYDMNFEAPGQASKTHPFIYWLVTDLSSGENSMGKELIKYQAPDSDNYHLFVLYEQQGTENLNANINDLVRRCPGAEDYLNCMFDASKFMKDNNLTPVGFTGFHGKKDPYFIKKALFEMFKFDQFLTCKSMMPSTKMMMDGKCQKMMDGKPMSKPEKKKSAMEFLMSYEPLDHMACNVEKLEKEEGIKKCLENLNKAMKMGRGEIAMEGDTKASAYLDVVYKMEKPKVVQACCKTHMYPRTMWRLKPLGQEGTSLWMFQADEPPAVKLHGGKSDKMYTLMMVAHGVDMPGVGTEKKPPVLWLSTNAPAPSIGSGKQVITYMKPTKPYMYFFIVYEQTRELMVNPMMYGKRCLIGEDQETRCLFDLKRFVYDNDLKMVAGNWMMPKADATMVEAMKKMKMSEKAACKYAFPNMMPKHDKMEDKKMECPEHKQWAADGDCSPDSRKTVAGMNKCLQAMNNAAANTWNTPFVPKNQRFDTYLDVSVSSVGYLALHQCCFNLAGGFKTSHLSPIEMTPLPVSYSQGAFNVSIKTAANLNGVQGSSVLYTLMMVDRTSWVVNNEQRSSNERPWLHWLVVNIPGSDVMAGDELAGLFKPMTGHLHDLYLYRQNGRIPTNVNVPGYTLPCTAIPGRCSFNLRKFVSDYGLVLKSATFLQSQIDGYGLFTRTQMFGNDMESECKKFVPELTFSDGMPQCKDYEKLSPCAKSRREKNKMACYSAMLAGLAESDMKFMNKMFIKSLRLLEVEYESDPMKVSVCCNDFSYEKEEVYIDPIADSVDGVESHITMKAPKVDFEAEQGKLYTLMMVDFSDKLPGFRNATHPVVHWMVTNMKGPDDKGDVILPYYPAQANKYLIVLLEQTMKIQANVGMFVEKCPINNEYRCMFNIMKFMYKHKMKVIAGNSFRGKMDALLVDNMIKYVNIPEARACRMMNPNTEVNDEGKLLCAFRSTRPTPSGGTVLTGSLFSLAIALLLAFDKL